MIVGRKERFAIEAEPEDFQDDWILGRFRFWLCGHEVGDWDDSAALQMCYGWLRKFGQQPPDCTEPEIARKSPEEIFSLLVDPVMSPGGTADPARQPIPNAYERFHISYLGMSSCDTFTVLLIKGDDGTERCLWRKHGKSEIHYCWLSPGEMENVAREFCDAFEARFIAKPR